MGRACSTHGGDDKMTTTFCFEDLKVSTTWEQIELTRDKGKG